MTGLGRYEQSLNTIMSTIQNCSASTEAQNTCSVLLAYVIGNPCLYPDSNPCGAALLKLLQIRCVCATLSTALDLIGITDIKYILV